MRRSEAVAGLVFERTVDARHRVLALIGVLLCGALGLALSESGLPHATRTGATGTQAARGKAPARSSAAAFTSVQDTRVQVSDEVGAIDRSFWPRAEKDALVASGGGLRAVFSAMGASFGVKDDTVGLSFGGLGGGPPPRRVSPQAHHDRIVYAYKGVSEFYRSGPAGVEQGFSVGRPARATSELVIDLRTSGTLIPRVDGSGIVFQRPGGSTSVRYDDLAAVDAAGRRLAARIELASGLVRLRVAAAHARYPVTIDPFIEEGKLKGLSAKGSAGWSVALSETAAPR